MRKIKTEAQLFLTALMFYTRLPVPWNVPYSPEVLHRSTRYITLVGLVVGGVGGGIFVVANAFLPVTVAVILSMAATALATGAFHEDGFADTCDGMGGGYTPQRTLEIMKDSRIGTYGATGLVLILLVKFYCLVNIPLAKIPLILIAAHALSRLVPVCIIYSSRYVRLDSSSKIKAIGQRGSVASLVVATSFGVVAIFFVPWQAALVVVGITLVHFIVFRSYLHRKLGGYTGDVLGASQQIAEVLFYIGYLGAINC